MYISTNKSNYEYIRAALTTKLSKSKFFEPGHAVSLHRYEPPEISRRTYRMSHTASSDLLRNPRLKPMPAWILNLTRDHNECESPLINEMIM